VTELVALLDGREVGRVRQTRGRLGFRYADSWRLADGAYPLSLSMPLLQPDHGHGPIGAFLWGLLPDNEVVLQRWARQFKVSARSAFALIREVGEDCAGAIQFVPAERLAEIQSGQADNVAWLTEDDIAERLRLLRTDAAAGRLEGDAGHFSLAGAQPKTALLYDGQRWGVPAGRIPTSHILKPALPNLDGHVENEHICLNLARALGLPAARSEARMFGDQQTIVIERYDRVDNWAYAPAGSGETAMPIYRGHLVHRVHQEDLCQALAVSPGQRYQADGGPGAAMIIDLLRSVVFPPVAFSPAVVPPAVLPGEPRSRQAESGHSAMAPAGSAATDDIATFRDALILNWLIGGTDAHAKNFSLLLGGRGLVRLAPLYDVATALVYPHLDPMKARMAMSIGGEYRLDRIGPRHWRRFAAETRLNEAALISRIDEMATALPDHLSDELRRAHAIGLRHPVLVRLRDALTERARLCARLIEGSGPI
jgi:serine/threonine-protein kinase HipA